ncbi:hypothetical protein Pint_15483 [Pistacia integerrima]|uniref:Uncharacterized protein n=1 Tax=Pistacia integerrima TaxID=434235 RepID=A0ACC0ZBJ6_9ROSI|nr:hypothetical protein Pint_15483 [Pistacia integerrima]
MLPTDSYFISNFVKVMEFLSGEVKKQGHADFYINNPPPNIYGLAQCHEDLSSTDCELCFAAARTKVPRCLPSESARIFLDGCFLRYDDYDFFKETIDPVYDTVNCSSPTGLLADDSLHKQFEAKLGELITNVTRQAKSNGGFAVAEGKGGVVSVYALAQCWATVSDEGCGQCLDKAGQELRNCSPGSDGRAMYTGCYMRYSVERFFNTEPEPEDSEEYSKMTIAITIGAISFAILSCFGCFMGYKRLSRKREDQVWRHYKEQKITHSVDAGLAGRFPEKEASNVLQIGLLCTQASWALRPSMSQVVEMLNNKDYEIPSPKQPPFLNASVITGDEYSCKDSIVSSQKSLFITSLNESSPR